MGEKKKERGSLAFPTGRGAMEGKKKKKVRSWFNALLADVRGGRSCCQLQSWTRKKGGGGLEFVCVEFPRSSHAEGKKKGRGRTRLTLGKKKKGGRKERDYRGESEKKKGLRAVLLEDVETRLNEGEKKKFP